MARMPQKELDKLQLPDGFELWSASPFAGLNLEADRIGIQDNEFYDLENYIKIGDNRLRTVWDKGTALYSATAGKTIISFFWFNIGNNNYCAIFFSDGTAVQINEAGTVVTTISSTIGRFYTGVNLPAVCQWGTQYLLISNNAGFSNYWVWDGSVLYAPGTVGPFITANLTNGGSGYTSQPTLTAFGGAGTGVTATANIENDTVVGVVITNPGSGFIPGDVVQLQFAGGGTDSGAILKAVLASGTVSYVNVLNGGSAYTGTGIAFSGGGGTGAAAYATLSGGVITAVTMTSGGSGYTGTPTVSSTSASGSGFSAAAFLTAGSVASVTVVSGGTNFISTPALTFSGGGGLGAAANVTLSAGAIYSVSVTSGGHGYTSPPAVIVTPGSNNAAQATLSLMPIGVSGAAIETYQSRVWLLNTYTSPGATPNGGTLVVSAPANLTDFATSDGADTFVSNEPFLKRTYTAVRQAQGYLYTFGDSATDYVSGVVTTGSPSTTTFSYQNVDPQTGAAWRDTAQYYGLSIIFGNTQGIFGLYGGAVKKLSKKITTLVDNAIWPPTAGAVYPSSAVVNIHTVKVYMMLMTVQDPVTSAYRTVMVGWDEKEWYIFSQSVTPTYIGTKTVNSNYTAWATDGTNLFQMFATPSVTLTKKFSTKLFGGNTFPIVKQGIGLWVMTRDDSNPPTGVSFTGTMDTENGSAVIPYPLNMGGNPILGSDPGDIFGTNIGITLSSNSADFELRNLVLGYVNYWGGMGDPPAFNSTV